MSVFDFPGRVSWLLIAVSGAAAYAALLALGVTIAWYPSFTHAVTWAALWDFMTAFQTRGTKAWDDFIASREGRPYPRPEVPADGEGDAKQQELEKRYFCE